MKRILFVHNGPTRFIHIDRALLAQRYLVTEYWERSAGQIRPHALAHAVRAHDLVFCWFASWHAFLPVLLARVLRRPSLVVIGGYDTANLPEAGYGSQRGGLPRLITRLTIHLATQLIANSHSAKEEAVANAKADARKVDVIYHGLEPISIGPLQGRPCMALTVGNLWRENLLRKGLLYFVQAAAHLPGVHFVHVGQWQDSSIEDLRRVAGPNVAFKGFLPDEQLNALYAQASVYVQASLHEGFGLSVAEAMLGGCIPVVTRRGALPEVVGDTGIYTTSTDPQELAAAVRQALSLDGSARRRARERILTHFSLDRRRQALYTLIDQLTLAGSS